MKFLRILFVIVFCQSLHAYSDLDESINNPAWWVNFGVGVGTTFNNSNADIGSGVSAQLGFNGRISPNTFLTAYSNHIGKNDSLRKDAYDLGILYGYVSRKPTWYWSGSVGLCYYKLEKDEYNYGWYIKETTKQGMGAPLQFQLFKTPFAHFGFGIIGHAVLSENPYANIMFAIQGF